jgi:N-methylhydantoinase B
VAVDDAIRWDGTVYPYLPPKDLRIDPSLKLHRDVGEGVDPITYEVLRHALWNVNTEHGNTIMKISGSPICAYGHDFNPVILDEYGDYVYFGAFLQYLAGATSSAVKWILENRSTEPGIRPGDAFLSNDPWVGAGHQSDVALLAPVFVGDELFCWVGNTLHQWDIGGTAPGGFNPNAPDVFWEPPCIPPVKIVEGGKIRVDIEQYYLRSSRVPALVALDLRAEITGCSVARDRILALVKRYGAATVKATMRKIQDDAERAFVRRLDSIPDGTWTEEGWIEMQVASDRGIYKNRVVLTKTGDKLIFSNAGTAPQGGSICASHAAWRGAVLSMLNAMTLFDQMFAIEGALRHCEFVVEPETITCPKHPAAVSGAPPQTLLHSIGLGGMVLSKMLAASTDASLREEVMSCMSLLGFPLVGITGLDQRGSVFASILLDAGLSGFPALPYADGQDTSGAPWDLQSTTPNVENQELYYPLLWLWRRELADSGGAGKFRGGNSSEVGIIAHMTDRVDLITVTTEVAIPAPGLHGGYPSSTNKFLFMHGARVREQLERTGRMPSSAAEVGGEPDFVPAKSQDRVLGPEDLFVVASAGASGYGDPLERLPGAVLIDVLDGKVTREWALAAYGVVIVGQGRALRVDERATAERREQMLASRLEESRPWSGEAPDQVGDQWPPDGRVSEYVAIEDGEYRCGGVSLGPANGNYRLGALIRELPLTDANPLLEDPKRYTDAEVTFRQLICPQTGRLIDTELPIDGAPPQWDHRPGQVDVVTAQAGHSQATVAGT